MFGHVGFNAMDFDRSLALYKVALAPPGLGVLHQGQGWGMLGGPDGRLGIGAFGPPGGPVHLAFRANDRAAVRDFHEAALAASRRDNDAPGLRPNYAPDYHAASVFDPEGHNVEAVTAAGEA